MGRRRKLYDRIQSTRSDRNIQFSEIRTLLIHLGFEERVKGYHHVFKREGISERVDLQPANDGRCKPYQVRQLRDVLNRYNLGEEL